MKLDHTLALVDAILTFASLVCLVCGYRAIRRKEVARHKRMMLGAFLTSAAFVVVFVLRFATFGFGKFAGTGVLRGIYLGVFFSHEPLAVVNVPLAVATLFLGLRQSIAAHREVARITLPVWTYVATTGLVIYSMLYVG